MSIKRKYLIALKELEEIKSKSKDPLEISKKALEYLRKNFDKYNWVGIYILEENVLKLLDYSGDKETEHKIIPIDKGLCGMSVREKRIINVPDVSSSSEYLQCFLETKSELVVPMFFGNKVIGEIDIDSYRLNAFDNNDEWFISKVCEILAPVINEYLENNIKV